MCWPASDRSEGNDFLSGCTYKRIYAYKGVGFLAAGTSSGEEL